MYRVTGISVFARRRDLAHYAAKLTHSCHRRQQPDQLHVSFLFSEILCIFAGIAHLFFLLILIVRLCTWVHESGMWLFCASAFDQATE